MNILVAGAGALGSQIAFWLARPGVRLYIWDDDRVEPHNVGTTVYYEHHVGRSKAISLCGIVLRRGGTVLGYNNTQLTFNTLENCMGLIQFDLFVDCFDNFESRSLLPVHPVVHVGVSQHQTGSVEWNETWKPPAASAPRGSNPVCTHQLGVPILRSTALSAVWAIEQYADSGRCFNAVVTPRSSIWHKI